MSFTFLHSVQSNVALFSDALKGTGLTPADHDVRNEILSVVTERGGLDSETSAAVVDAVTENAQKADLVLLTCSSLSPVVDGLQADNVAVERTDRLLAEAVFADVVASKGEASVAVLIVAPTTLDATGALFEASRSKLGAEDVKLDIVLLPGVWDLFLAGDLSGYKAALSREIDAYLTKAVDVTHIALGQASMGPALDACSSPRAGDVWTVAGATRDYLQARFC